MITGMTLLYSRTYLEGLGQEKALLHIILLRLLLIHVAQSTIAVRSAAMLLQCQHRLPAPVTVLLVVGEAPQHEIALECLRPEYVVFLLGAQGTRLGRIAEAAKTKTIR